MPISGLSESAWCIAVPSGGDAGASMADPVAPLAARGRDGRGNPAGDVRRSASFRVHAETHHHAGADRGAHRLGLSGGHTRCHRRQCGSRHFPSGSCSTSRCMNSVEAMQPRLSPRSVMFRATALCCTCSMSRTNGAEPSVDHPTLSDNTTAASYARFVGLHRRRLLGWSH